MVSSLFRSDYNKMRREGLEPTLDDIIRLNALAVKVERAAKPCDAVALPRAAFVGRLILREPTLGHTEWIERVGEYIDLNRERNFIIVHAFALSRDSRDLPDALQAVKVVKKVYAFARKELIKLFERGLREGIAYCLFGSDYTSDEFGSASKGADDTQSFSAGVIVSLNARRIGLSLAEARQLTISEIGEIIQKTDILSSGYDPDAIRNLAFGHYVRTRNEIRERLKLEQIPVKPMDKVIS